MFRMTRCFVLCALLSSVVAAGQDFSLPAVYSQSGEIRSQSVPLDKLAKGQNYSLLFSVGTALSPKSRITVQIVQAGRVLARKTLHMGDAEFYAAFTLDSGARPELQ